MAYCFYCGTYDCLDAAAMCGQCRDTWTLIAVSRVREPVMTGMPWLSGGSIRA